VTVTDGKYNVEVQALALFPDCTLMRAMQFSPAGEMTENKVGVEENVAEFTVVNSVAR